MKYIYKDKVFKKKIKIDLKRDEKLSQSRIMTIEYDSKRNAYISLLYYDNGKYKYILYPRGILIGDIICNSNLFIGSAKKLTKISPGTYVHNIEIIPGRGGQLVRAAGTSAKIISEDSFFFKLRLPSGKISFFFKTSKVTVGQVGNIESKNIKLCKAGSKIWLGKRPKVRKKAMNPIDQI
nr:ribosomal protein L2 [Thismia panamensis]